MANQKKKRGRAPKRPSPPRRRGKRLIFRRYRKDPKTGEILDAHDYGHEAWPLWV